MTSRYFRFLCVGMLVVPAVWFSSVLTTSAQNQNGVLTVEPAQLSVTGVRGSATTRQLVVTSSVPIADPEPIPLDLVRTDGARVLPAIKIRTEIVTQPKPNEVNAQVHNNSPICLTQVMTVV